MAAIKKHLLALAVLLLLQRQASAKVTQDLVLNYFQQGGGDGKQVYDGSGDQSMTLYEPVLYIDSQIDHNTNLSATFVFDALSSASAKAFDSGTGASGGKKSGGGDDGEGDDGGGGLLQGWQTRYGADAAYSKRRGSWVFTPSAGLSHELTYNSLHGGLNVQKFLAEDNFVLSGGFFHYSDFADPWNLATSHFAGFKAKTTNSANLSASQLLDEKSVLLAGVSFTRQNGFLEGTRNTVSTGTVTERASEALPGARDKRTFNVRYVRSLRPALAFHLDYRYYADTWDIRAQTWEPALAWSFRDEAGTARLYYRRYAQTAAKYYRDSFPVMTKYMTSDSDLAKFDANEAGLQVTWSPEPEEGEAEWTYGGAVVYYKRSDGLHAAVVQASVSKKF